MNQEGAPTGEHLATAKARRRFPHLLAGDLAILSSLPPGKAREFERMLRQQYRAARRQRAHETPEADLGDNALEQIHARRTSQWTHGPGGGRRQATAPACD